MDASRKQVLVGCAGLLVIGLGVGITIRRKPAPLNIQSNKGCPTTQRQRVAKADLILTGRVDMVLPDSVTGAKAVIIPDQIFKGSSSFPTVSVLAADDQQVNGRSGSDQDVLHLKSGVGTYLFYLRKVSDATYVTRPCDGSRFLDSTIPTDEKNSFTQTT